MTVLGPCRGFGLALAALILALSASLGEAQQDSTGSLLVIQGGTLIDGTGRAPIENSVIVIDGNRIKAVGRSGEVAVPPGSRIVVVNGKTILPGFIDGHCHWESFWGEIY